MNSITYSLFDLAPKIGAKVVGNGDFSVVGLASLESATVQHISFVNGEKYLPQTIETNAGALIISQPILDEITNNPEYQTLLTKQFLVVDSPYAAFAMLTHVFEEKQAKSGVEHTAQIHPSVIMPKNVYIGHNVVISEGCSIGEGSIICANTFLSKGVSLGENCFIESNVSLLARCQLGNNVRIHANTVIGGEGFGFAPYQGQWHRIAQLGSVRIGNNVRIGSNCSIDRGALDDTIIGQGVIIDNLVQIAHNVQIGDNTAIAAKCGIAGSTKIGKNCILAGACGIAGHLQIADNVTLTGMAMVTKSITEEGTYSSGTGLFNASQWKKVVVRLRQLADLPLTQIAKKVEDMHSQLNKPKS